MGSSRQSEVVYKGDVVITDFDPDDLSRLNEILADITDIEEGEDLYVSIPGGERIEVAKLREDTG